MKQLTLILGGARAGKSAFAARLAAQHKKVLFVATAEARDAEMRRKIAAHQASRPKAWATLEEPVALVQALRAHKGRHEVVLLDCLTLWVSNLLLTRGPLKEKEMAIQTETARLLECYRAGSAGWIVVSNEVGLGVVPPTRLGRVYRDVLGRVNQLFAAEADRVYLVVAGIPMAVREGRPKA